MTEGRLKEVLWDCTGMDADNHPYIIEAMKQACNESIDEAARIAMDNMLPKTSEEITNLKVK